MPPWPSACRDPREEESEEREGDVEHHLGRQAPQLGQPGDVPLHSQALQLEEVGDPHGASGSPRLGYQHQCAEQHRQPGGDEPCCSPDGVGAAIRGRVAEDEPPRVGAVEEQAAEHEEDGDADVHPCQEAGQDRAARRSREEPRMRQEDGHGSKGTQPLELEKVVGARSRARWRGDGRGAHEPAPTDTTWAEVTQTPAVFGVSTTTVIEATAVPEGTGA